MLRHAFAILILMACAGFSLARWDSNGAELHSPSHTVDSAKISTTTPQTRVGDVASSRPDDPWHGALIVEAIVKKPLAAADGLVSVSLRIVNRSHEDQSFGIWSCSWQPQWSTDDKRFTPVGGACDKNFPMQKKLAPGDAWTGTLELSTPKHLADGKYTIHMIFSPLDTKAKLMSQPLTITVGK